MSDTLPLSPLTHEELNHRANRAITEAGHRAISVAGLGYTEPAAEKFAECAAAFYLYNGAALVRCEPLVRAA
jgi:hypothetical protein